MKEHKPMTIMDENALLKDALMDMLNQFGGNYCLSAVENACDVLCHPRADSWEDKDGKIVCIKGDACYCREVVYSPVEAERRRKLSLQFTDKSTNEKVRKRNNSMAKVVKSLLDLQNDWKYWQKKLVVVQATEVIEDVVDVHTREGVVKGYKGDFIIKGVEGEVYPCGRDIFFKTYEAVENKED